MKKNILFFIFLINCLNFAFGQEKEEIQSLDKKFETYIEKQKIYEIYNKAKYQYDSLKLYDQRIVFKESKREDFIKAYSKLLNLTDYNNLNIQNALLKDYLEKNKIKLLKFNFKSREEVEKNIKMFDDAFISSLTILYLENIQKYYIEYRKKFELYIDRNLKRLNISKKDFENLSDKDKELLWEEFR